MLPEVSQTINKKPTAYGGCLVKVSARLVEGAGIKNILYVPIREYT